MDGGLFQNLSKAEFFNSPLSECIVFLFCIYFAIASFDGPTPERLSGLTGFESVLASINSSVA